MITQLMRQDPAFRRLPFWLIMAMVWATAVVGMAAWITARGGPVEPDLLVALCWFSAALYLVFGEIGTRTNSFNLGLPIAAREMWLAHFVAVALTGIAVLAMSVGMTVSSLVLIGKLVDRWWVEAEALITLGGFLVAGLFLAVGIVHMFRPAAQEVPMSPQRAGWSLLAATVPLVLILLLRPLGTFGVVIVFGLAAAAFTYVLRAIPEALSVPVETRHGFPPEAAEVVPWATTQRKTGLWFALRTVHGVTTCAKKPFAIWIVFVFLLFLGFWVSGIDARWSSSTQRFAYPFMIVYTLLAATTLSLARFGVIDWLPWSRRRALALITMPFFLTVFAGYGIGRVTDSILGGGDDELLCFTNDREAGESHFCVLLSACQISWTGAVPEISSPWGETHEPWSRRVVKGLPLRVYFPYDIPQGSSVDFAALQISRAANAVFGANVSPDDIRTRYLETGEEGSAPTLTLQADYPALKPVGRGVYFPWIMAIVVVLWALLTAAYMHWLRGGVPEKRRKVMGYVIIAVPMLFWICDFVLEASGTSEIFVRNALFVSLSRSAGATVVGTLGVWVGSALLVWGTYRLVERRFERAELMTEMDEKCITG